MILKYHKRKKLILNVVIYRTLCLKQRTEIIDDFTIENTLDVNN